MLYKKFWRTLDKFGVWGDGEQKDLCADKMPDCVIEVYKSVQNFQLSRVVLIHGKKINIGVGRWFGLGSLTFTSLQTLLPNLQLNQ